MSDIVERLKSGTCGQGCGTMTECVCATAEDAADEITRLRAEVEKLKAAYSATQHDIQQTLGKALRYPWFKDDQKNFPHATEADGVCVGDHVAESLADEAAAKITALRAEVEDLGNRLHHVHRLWANNEHALRAENERLRAALGKINVGEGWAALIARAALEEKQ